MAERLQGVAHLAAGTIQVRFELSGTLALGKLEIAGVLRDLVEGTKLSKVEEAFEGAPLDADILKQIAKRTFQENEVAVHGVRPEDLVRAILSA